MPVTKMTVAAALLLLAVSAGCAGNAPRDDAAPEDDSASQNEMTLAGPTWQLEAFGEAAGEARPALAETKSTAVFSASGRVSGTGGCNRYRASFEQRGDALAVSSIASTKKMCAPPIIQQERQFFEALRTARRWERAGRRLTLWDGHGERLMRLATQDTAAAVMHPQPVGETLVFSCDAPHGEGFQFRARTGPGELAVWLPERFGGRYLVLGQVRAASGARYEGADVLVWNKGDEALLEVNGTAYRGCTRALR